MGIIVSSISAAILISMTILIFATANTLRPPSWLLPVASLIGIAGILLMSQGNRQKQSPS